MLMDIVNQDQLQPNSQVHNRVLREARHPVDIAETVIPREPVREAPLAVQVVRHQAVAQVARPLI